MISPGLTGFVDIVSDADKLLGVVQAKVGVDRGGEVVQVIHYRKRTLLLFLRNQEINKNWTENASIY